MTDVDPKALDDTLREFGLDYGSARSGKARLAAALLEAREASDAWKVEAVHHAAESDRYREALERIIQAHDDQNDLYGEEVGACIDAARAALSPKDPHD